MKTFKEILTESNPTDEAVKKARTKSIPTLAMSAAATKEDIEKALDAGFQQYITKPINLREVIEAIQHWGQSGCSSSKS